MIFSLSFEGRKIVPAPLVNRGIILPLFIIQTLSFPRWELGRPREADSEQTTTVFGQISERTVGKTTTTITTRQATAATTTTTSCDSFLPSFSGQNIHSRPSIETFFLFPFSFFFKPQRLSSVFHSRPLSIGGRRGGRA